MTIAAAGVTDEEIAEVLGEHQCKCGKVFEVESDGGSGLLMAHPEPVCAWFRETFVRAGLAEPMSSGGSA